MSKFFRYEKVTGHYFCQYQNDWELYTVEFDYEVADEDLLPEILQLLLEEYFSDCENEDFIKQRLSKMIEENHLIEKFATRYEATLKEIFRQEALEFYND
jgi:hypothetical protein